MKQSMLIASFRLLRDKICMCEHIMNLDFLSPESRWWVNANPGFETPFHKSVGDIPSHDTSIHFNSLRGKATCYSLSCPLLVRKPQFVIK